jgi:hypothetical protein
VDNGGVIDLTSPRLDGFSWLSAEESEVDSYVSVSSKESVSVSDEKSESSEDISSVFVEGEVMALPLPWWLGEASPLTCLSPVFVAGEALPLS